MMELETHIYIAMMVIGAIAIPLVILYRARINPFQKHNVIPDWSPVADTSERGSQFFPTGCAGTDDLVLCSMVRKLHEPVVAVWNQERHTFTRAFGATPELQHLTVKAIDKNQMLLASVGKDKIAYIDYEGSVKRHTAKIEKIIETGIPRISALCFVKYNNQRLLAIASRGRQSKIYLLDPKLLFETGDFVKSLRYWFRDSGNTIAMTWDGRRLYKTAANIGRDIIYRIDLSRAVQNGSFLLGVDWTFSAPGSGTRGLSYIRDKLWICDANSRRIFPVVPPDFSQS